MDPDLPTGGSTGRGWDIAMIVALGGALGGAGRWALDEIWPTPAYSFPWATVVENTTGCLLLGALMALLLQTQRVGRYARPFVATGILGGFTTFSAYTSDTRSLLANGDTLLAVAYLIGTLLIALAATWIGMQIGRVLFGNST